jgi:hypothetical protein
MHGFHGGAISDAIGSVANDRRNCDYLHCLSMPKGPLLPQLWNL